MAQCYVNANNQTAQQRPSWTTILGNDCCQAGDIPLPNHICYNPDKNQPGDFYPAGYTDKACLSSNDPSCPQRDWCRLENAPAFIKFYPSNNTWQCCGANSVGLHQSCNPASGATFQGPLSEAQYDDILNDVHRLAVGAIVGIAVAAFAFLVFWAVVIWCCCCSRRARERRSRGKFVPLGKGRDQAGDNVVWNSNVHDGGHELHDGPMGGYAAPPPGPGPHAPPQYTVQGFR